MWVFYAFLSAIFAAGVAIVGKLGLKNLDSTLATTVRSIIMALFLIAVSLSLKKFNGFTFHSLSGRDWTLIIFAGIFGALSWLFYFFALKHGQATPVVAIDRLSMVFVFIMALIFLGEPFSWRVLVGVVLMVGGAILISVK
ncbi:MAG: EamA family transporter [Patescibacteria group bacterium]|jgi:transporter family protein